MCESGEKLQFQPESVHHSVTLFDRYFSLPHSIDLLNNFNFLNGTPIDQVLQFSSLICMLISAKFLEKTYPGFQKLNSLIKI